MRDVYDAGEYQVHYRTEEQEGRTVCMEILDYVQDGVSVKKEDLEKDYVIIEEFDIQVHLDDRAGDEAN